ncbi:MAG: threonine aldolase, partial [bacterium]
AWLSNAQHANACAARLAALLASLPGLHFLSPRQANSVFVELPAPIAEALRDRGSKFYTFIGDHGVRLMCSWDTTEADIQQFFHDLQQLWQAR